MGKHLQKRQMRLQSRIIAHEEASKRRTDQGRGLNKPGSMSGRK